MLRSGLSSCFLCNLVSYPIFSPVAIAHPPASPQKAATTIIPLPVCCSQEKIIRVNSFLLGNSTIIAKYVSPEKNYPVNVTVLPDENAGAVDIEILTTASATYEYGQTIRLTTGLMAGWSDLSSLLRGSERDATKHGMILTNSILPDEFE